MTANSPPANSRGPKRSFTGQPCHDPHVMTLLVYAGGAVLVIGAIYGLGVFVLPRGEQIAPAIADARPWYLVTGRRMSAEDVITVRLPVALRGYRFGETDVL